ncbi:hypothetical protein DYB35_013027 [Aphanomyces astaci]|uniref:Uncharacterized protein n=2 Tax=Aphanomyces astaci TaxID=112090 RepID=A0A3R6WGY6_APHAT|nr:hypothetical protein DYB35_013027 [Aphanomyces astaci]
MLIPTSSKAVVVARLKQLAMDNTLFRTRDRMTDWQARYMDILTDEAAEDIDFHSKAVVHGIKPNGANALVRNSDDFNDKKIKFDISKFWSHVCGVLSKRRGTTWTSRYGADLTRLRSDCAAIISRGLATRLSKRSGGGEMLTASVTQPIEGFGSVGRRDRANITLGRKVMETLGYDLEGLLQIARDQRDVWDLADPVATDVSAPTALQRVFKT